MTLEGWGLSAITKIAGYATNAVVTYYSQPTGDSESSKKLEPLDFTKLVESISGAITLGMLAMKPSKTKIYVHENAIQFSDPSNLQWLHRTGVGSRQDFREHFILQRCIKMPQKWYPLDSEEARAIARIYKVTIIGLKVLQDLYKKDYLAEHIQKYIKSANKFINKVERIEGKNQKAASTKEPQARLSDSEDFENDDLSEMGEDEGSMAMDAEMSEIMKNLYSKIELNYFADRLEAIWEHFQSDDIYIKEHVSGEIQGLVQSLAPKIKLYQEKMYSHIRSKYFNPNVN